MQPGDRKHQLAELSSGDMCYNRLTVAKWDPLDFDAVIPTNRTTTNLTIVCRCIDEDKNIFQKLIKTAAGNC